MLITREYIHKIGLEARNSVSEPILGQCYPASKYIVDKLNTDDANIKEVFVGNASTTRHHYVVQLTSSYINEDLDSYSVLIDVTLDQYCDENYKEENVAVSFGKRENIDKINIYEPGRTPYNNI